MSNEPKPLTLEEVAAHFRVNERTVRRWIANGCPVMRPSEGIIRFNLNEVLDWSKASTASAERAAV